MKQQTLFIIAIVLLFSSFGLSQTLPPADDLQFWNETSLTFPLIKTIAQDGKKSTRIEGFVSGILRIGQNIRHFTDERIGGGLNFKFNKYLSASTSYLYAADQPYQGARRGFEHRLRFDLSIEKKWKQFSLKDRNRVEYRIRNSRRDSTRYRNKLQLNIPIKRGDSEFITPFVANEVYYDFSQNEWSRNEFSVGVIKKLNKNLTGEFFYSHQNNTGSVLKRRNIIGINLKFKID